MQENLPPKRLTLQEADDEIAELWTVVGYYGKKLEALTEALGIAARYAGMDDVADAMDAIHPPPAPERHLRVVR